MKANWTVIIIKKPSSIKGLKFKKTDFFFLILFGQLAECKAVDKHNEYL